MTLIYNNFFCFKIFYEIFILKNFIKTTTVLNECRLLDKQNLILKESGLGKANQDSLQLFIIVFVYSDKNDFVIKYTVFRGICQSLS